VPGKSETVAKRFLLDTRLPFGIILKGHGIVKVPWCPTLGLKISVGSALASRVVGSTPSIPAFLLRREDLKL
jgi:hypothetical protein